MAVYRRGNVYWFDFWFRGERYQRSTGQANKRVAEQMEAAFRTALAKGDVGILERKRPPVLKDFGQRFMDFVQARCAAKPSTVEFYAFKLQRLLEFEPLAAARLDAIDEALIECYVQHRRQRVSPATVNRELATLRRGLRLAYEWKLIDRVPCIRLLPGERTREFVVGHAQEQLYLGFAPQPLRDVATLILDTGLRLGEVLNLEWQDVHLQPATGAKFGWLHVGEGKSKQAKRNIPLTARVRAMLGARQASATSHFVFTDESGTDPLSRFTVRDQHAAIRAMLKLPSDAVIHSLRHTYGTRLGEAGADAFTIMRLMGHSTVTVSQRYVHPTPEAMERAVERLESLNEKATKALPKGGQVQTPYNFPYTQGVHS